MTAAFHWFLPVSVLIAAGFFSVQANAEREIPEDPVVIEVGDLIVRRSELDDRFQVAVRLLAHQQGVPLSAQDPATIGRLREQYLDKHETEMVMLEEADRRNISLSDDEVELAIDDLFPDAADKERFLASLSDNGIDGKTVLREIVRDEKTIQLLTEHLLKEIKIPPGDVITLHHDVKDRLATPEEVCIRHIQTETESKAEKVLDELRSGGDFAALADKYSTDEASAGMAGDLGCFEKGGSGSHSDFEKAAFAAGKGDIVGPVESRFGFHVLEVYDVHESRVPTLNEAYADIERELALEKLPERIDTLVNDSGIRTYPEKFSTAPSARD